MTPPGSVFFEGPGIHATARLAARVLQTPGYDSEVPEGTEHDASVHTRRERRVPISETPSFNEPRS